MPRSMVLEINPNLIPSLLVFIGVGLAGFYIFTIPIEQPINITITDSMYISDDVIIEKNPNARRDWGSTNSCDLTIIDLYEEGKFIKREIIGGCKV